MKTVTINSNPIAIKNTMKTAGTRIGSVEFHKRTDGTYRKMAFRFGVRNPKNVPAPTGVRDTELIDTNNTMVTVFDCNHRDENTGLRGAYRKVPLENVFRITVDGVVYNVLGKNVQNI